MRQFLENLTGLSIYPLIGIVIFGLFFMGMLVVVLTTRKSHYQHMAALPLESGTSTENLAQLTPASQPE